MRIFHALLPFIILLFSIIIGNNAVWAQTLNPVLTEAPKPLGDVRSLLREPDTESLKIVSERLVPELKAIPIRWHGFMLFPKLETSQYVNTNIFATDGNEEVDTITSLAPSLFVLKDYNRHQINLSVKANAQKYWSNSNEDIININTKLGGYLEASRAVKLPFEINHTIGHEKRSQNFSQNFTVKPTKLTSFGSALGITYKPNRLTLSMIGRYGQTAFDDGVNRAGTPIIKRDSDFNTASVEWRASYDLLPNHEPFISVSAGTKNYKRRNFQNGSFSGVDRSSKNTNILAGWNLAYKGLIEGYVGAGYGKRKYDDMQLNDIDSLKLAASINWNVSKKSTLSLGLRRAITDDNDIVQGIVLTQGHIQLDHEFLHNLFFEAYADQALADFQDISREDDISTIGLGFRYVINPAYTLSSEYQFQKRATTASGLDYDQNLFMVRLKKQF